MSKKLAGVFAVVLFAALLLREATLGKTRIIKAGMQRTWTRF